MTYQRRTPVTDTTHPKALEAQRQAEQRAVERAAMKEIVKAATQQDVHFVEIQPVSYANGNPVACRTGRMTIAYKPMRRNVIAVSTSICHPGDEFNKLFGRARAAVMMAEGHSVLMRVPSTVDTKRFLRNAFTANEY
jgi:hypothetical protein